MPAGAEMPPIGAIWFANMHYDQSERFRGR